LWNNAFKMRIPEGDIRTDCMKRLQTNLKECLKEWKTEEQTKEIIDLYCTNVDTFEPGLQEILSLCALEAVDKCVNYLSNNQQYLEGTKLRHYGSLMSHVFDRNIDEEKLKKNRKAYLEHALKWPPFLVFAKMYMNVEYSSSLQDTCLSHMKIFVKTLNEACNALVDGSITIGHLDILLSGKDRFKSIVQELRRNEAAAILTTLQIREKELSAFRETVIVVKHFVYECKKIEGDVYDLERRLWQLTNLNQDNIEDDRLVLIKDVCRVQFPKFNATETAGTQNVQSSKPVIVGFNLSEEDLNAIPLVLQHTKAYSFKQIWIKNGRNTKLLKGRKLKVNEILTEVWPETRQQWVSLCEKLRNGDISFGDFEEYFYSEECNSSDKLEKELVGFTGDSTDCGWIQSRFDQFHNFKTVYTCLKGANAIMNIVGKYGLKGDFSHISQIIKITKGDDVEMKKFDVSLVKTCSILRGIDDKKVDCLTVFYKCQPLVDWLKDSMKSMYLYIWKSVAGLKELKVFVELASMSAGETDIEVDRVQFLHAATTGYAPLIFNLDTRCNDLHFIEMCESVWKELETDSKLPQKL
ncbi:Hypothetical predicted protein, partial [Mytilus galloprovincialis]